MMTRQDFTPPFKRRISLRYAILSQAGGVSFYQVENI
jgi:hypothetical protein